MVLGPQGEVPACRHHVIFRFAAFAHHNLIGAELAAMPIYAGRTFRLDRVNLIGQLVADKLLAVLGTLS